MLRSILAPLLATTALFGGKAPNVRVQQGPNVLVQKQGAMCGDKSSGSVGVLTSPNQKWRLKLNRDASLSLFKEDKEVWKSPGEPGWYHYEEKSAYLEVEPSFVKSYIPIAGMTPPWIVNGNNIGGLQLFDEGWLVIYNKKDGGVIWAWPSSIVAGNLTEIIRGTYNFDIKSTRWIPQY